MITRKLLISFSIFFCSVMSAQSYAAPTITYRTGVEKIGQMGEFIFTTQVVEVNEDTGSDLKPVIIRNDKQTEEYKLTCYEGDVSELAELLKEFVFNTNSLKRMEIKEWDSQPFIFIVTNNPAWDYDQYSRLFHCNDVLPD